MTCRERTAVPTAQVIVPMWSLYCFAHWMHVVIWLELYVTVSYTVCQEGAGKSNNMIPETVFWACKCKDNEARLVRSASLVTG
jgi:hypothetical protein